MDTSPSSEPRATLSMSMSIGRQLHLAAYPPVCASGLIVWQDAWHAEQQTKVHLSLTAEPYASVRISIATVISQLPLQIAIVSLACAQLIS